MSYAYPVLLCQLKDTTSKSTNFLAPTQLGGIDSDKQRLDAALFCMLHNALRYGAILVDVSFRVWSEAHENQSTVIGHVQLEELHLIWLSGIDYFVKGT